MNSIIIREMHKHEMQKAIDWARNEEWNPGEYDGECFYNADPNGFFVGLVNGEIVSIISAIKYGISYGFIGFYIVDEHHRGKGYGIKIWDEAISYLGDRISGLDGVPAQVNNYEKSGYVLAHKNLTFKGKSTIFTSTDKNIIRLSIRDFEDIKRYDALCFPDQRDEFLKCWIQQQDSYTLGYMHNDKLMGYAKIRKCPEAYKIGPLFADNEVIANKLMRALQTKIPEGSSFTIDLPENHVEAMKFVDTYQMEYSFETARMYKNGFPKIDTKKVFGITSYELG